MSASWRRVLKIRHMWRLLAVATFAAAISGLAVSIERGEVILWVLFAMSVIMEKCTTFRTC